MTNTPDILPCCYRVRWSQPKLRFTPIPITRYEVYVGRRELSPDEDPRRTRTVDVTQFDVCYTYMCICMQAHCMCIIHG